MLALLFSFTDLIHFNTEIHYANATDMAGYLVFSVLDITTQKPYSEWQIHSRNMQFSSKNWDG